MIKPAYLFGRSERGFFAEVYFPKKVAYQGTIFRALEDGYNEKIVKQYLIERIEILLTELPEYPANVFDPYRYGTLEGSTESKKEKVQKRIDMYTSPFKGWSMYEVDGMFFPEGHIAEERTQIVRLLFRFTSPHVELAQEHKCEDVLRTILYFVIETRGHLLGEMVWSETRKQQFLAMHEWKEQESKRKFAEENFVRIAQATLKWIDDCILFIFPYLVRKFSEEVLERGLVEDEIWATSFFDLTLNVIRKSIKENQENNQ
ncbi:MAG: hypothetical protein A3B25_01360 [Candidatus Ryanbacteria bacterium RIFCSPLOWO2_01_FULL_48_26]|uniref:Uncharacterized protein n=1 Tax=Candidatus Ryanbacteria bacterium RIFCSPLOWO2_01_FULL_48_26 TaxID=1802126 RepID=A0A1G2GTY5_9BACT|nr:MAG: hypothetical protein A3B25_01360 [Candidatus Ryanbacteria bacterium RIFCSPLOWO2_01_FULL_48_26]